MVSIKMGVKKLCLVLLNFFEIDKNGVIIGNAGQGTQTPSHVVCVAHDTLSLIPRV